MFYMSVTSEYLNCSDFLKIWPDSIHDLIKCGKLGWKKESEVTCLMETLLALDGAILLWIQEVVRQDWMTPFWKVITFLGDGGWFWIALSIALLIPKKTRYIGIGALLSLAIGALITNVTLKPLIARTRPYEVVEGLTRLIEKQSDRSFPSGHTCASFAVALVYYRYMPPKYGVSLVLLAACVAFSRLYLGVHYPTDIIGGILAGALASFVACWLINKLKKGYLRS